MDKYARCRKAANRRCAKCSLRYCDEKCQTLDWAENHADSCELMQQIGWTVGTIPVAHYYGHTGFGLVHQYWALVGLEAAQKLLMRGNQSYFVFLRNLISLSSFEDEEELENRVYRNRAAYIVAGVLWNDIPLVELERPNRPYDINDVKTKVTSDIADRYAFYNPVRRLRGSGDYVTKNYETSSRPYIIRSEGELDDFRLEPSFSWSTTWAVYQKAQELNLPEGPSITQFSREAKKAAEMHNNVWLPHHYMAALIDSEEETPEDVQARTSDIMQFWINRAVSESNPFFLGNILHLVADAFSPSHTRRLQIEPGVVKAIFFYALQEKGHATNENEETLFKDPFASVENLEYTDAIEPLAAALTEALAFWYWYYLVTVMEQIRPSRTPAATRSLFRARSRIKTENAEIWTPVAVKGDAFRTRDRDVRKRRVLYPHQGAVDYFLKTYCNIDECEPITTETMRRYWNDGPLPWADVDLD